MPPASEEPSPEQQSLDLLSRAMSLPAAAREAFVRREAGSNQALLDSVLSLLRHAEPPSTRPDASATPLSGTEQQVQSTATGELMEKLAKAPKLDTSRYQLEGEVARGGMGAIVKIHDVHLNRRLAMKLLLERAKPRDDDEAKLTRQLLGRFLEEAQVTSQLDHPGVVPVHELGLDQNGKVYFTMRMVKGRTASEVFQDAYRGENDWNLTRALEVILKVCDTMAYAHDKGVLHRDLKPSNVMVGRFGEAYVMDWGLAKVLGQPDRHDLRIRSDATSGVSRIESARKRDAETDTASSVVSMDGQQIGTPCYMSPEQARSEPLDARTDVYAIGAMSYELVTGRAPYTAPGARPSPYRILNEVIDGPPKRIEQIQKGVPAELVAIVDKAMARDREQRYASVVDLADDIRAFLAQRVVRAYRTGQWEETKLWFRRNKELAVPLVAAFCMLCITTALSMSLTFRARSAEARAHTQLLQNLSLTTTFRVQASRIGMEAAKFNRLKLVVTFERLLEDEPLLRPAWPEKSAAIEGWLSDAQQLLGQRDELAATVAAARRDAPRQDAGVADSATTFLANTLASLVDRLPQLEALLPEVQKRQRWAQQVATLTRAHPHAKVSWAEARAAIAKADGEVASALYAGQEIPLRDEDVWGLVPIGKNPQSKLWEFYDLRSAWDGSSDPATLPIPEHGPDGRLPITDESGIVFVLLPGGTLPPGVDADDQGAMRRLSIRLDPFFLGKYELTQGQWLRWTGKNPSSSKTEQNLALPLEQVSWLEVDPVLRALGLVLPSELQWEYAIRAGTTTRWWTGDDEAGIRSAENIAAQSGLLPVGSKSPNLFGLFDMGGNVWEWCADEFSEYGTERSGDGRRPEPPDGSVSRVLRSGPFRSDIGHAESDTRNDTLPADRSLDIGLRAGRTARR